MLTCAAEPHAGATMTPDQIALVQNSFRQLWPIRETASSLFYARLFELDPALRQLFPADLSEQRSKLMQMLSVVIGALPFIDGLTPTIENLGRRHARYGVRAEHFDTVGEALLWTLRDCLGVSFTDQVEQAWVLAYGHLTESMLRGMAQPALRKAA